MGYIMAMLSICSIMSCKDQVYPTGKVMGQNERGLADHHLSVHMACKCFSPSLVNETGRRWNVLHHASELTLKGKKQQRVGAYCLFHNWSVPFQNSLEIPFPKVYNTNSHENKSSSGHVYQRDQSCYDSSALEACNTERQLKALDSYFSKLGDDMVEQLSSCMSTSNPDTLSDEKEYRKVSSSQCEGKMTDVIEASGGYKTRIGLSLLKNYFSKLNTEIDTRKSTSISDEEASAGNSMRPPDSSIGEYNEKKSMIEKPDVYKHYESMDNRTDPGMFGNENIEGLQTNDEASDLYLISLLAGINIAVFLFEIASPIRNSDVEQLSLPLIYGAKINKLILLGEWWRLLTPMFLHSGFLHVALGCWVLLTFGPEVCRAYGPCTFLLIYILGGICGNFTSFIHTPELTVCGTGPVFAVIGAWLVYQTQNKEATDKEVSESMFWKAVIATALSFVLSSFGRIDDWTHLGAVISGVVFGCFTCPGLELDDSSSKNGQKEGIALVQRKSDPCKSLITFTIFVLVLASLVFFYEPELEMLEVDGIV
ncbi:RHOMBOID-like protein 9, chloroplastic isoform X2 [Phoenix dactylifera]|uniref:RHOMBOID-like protein 9, chloroplastic isoform X2 n=1 Tax=Phoenix dactylifera TaxID=42345 RepID=A0A8B8JC49_PHODC|nr:RHOMBOID-like protein 9, chloroplastic isoform X2 [Phoenix dactylifera]